MSTAPLYEDILEGPENGCSEWLITDDKIKIRVAYWLKEEAKGTIVLFPGRNEYIEKYGRTCTKLNDFGYATLVIDWRGQGLSDRLLKNPLIGHVDNFTDYQLDVKAVFDFIELRKLPKPLHLLAHSMGGAIALRALHNKLNVKKVIFSAPMWDIKMHQKYFYDKLLHIYGLNSILFYRALKMQNSFVPSADIRPYLTTAKFENNSLTTNIRYFQFLRNQIITHPELALAGPSIQWLNTALRECRKLQKLKPPPVPCLTLSSLNDRIVSNTAIQHLSKHWKNCNHLEIGNIEHEILMESFNLLEFIYSAIENFLE